MYLIWIVISFNRRCGGVVLTRLPTKQLPLWCTGSNPVNVVSSFFNSFKKALKNTDGLISDIMVVR